MLIEEVKLRLAGGQERFRCACVAHSRLEAVLLYTLPRPRLLHGIALSQGTLSFGYFWVDRPYNLYHFLQPDGLPIAYYFNLSDQTRIEPGRLFWRDLVVDILVSPGLPAKVLDEAELPDDLSEALHKKIDAGRDEVLSQLAQLMSEADAASQRYYQELLASEGRSRP